jgi:hypothetical protein
VPARSCDAVGCEPANEAAEQARLVRAGVAGSALPAIGCQLQGSLVEVVAELRLIRLRLQAGKGIEVHRGVLLGVAQVDRLTGVDVFIRHRRIPPVSASSNLSSGVERPVDVMNSESGAG